MKNDKVKVQYATDDAGDHQAEITQLTKDKIREFNSLEEAEPFISECTLVRNLDELYEVVNTDIASKPEVPQIDAYLLGE